MRKHLLSITIFLSAIFANAQTNVDSVIFDKHKAERLIIGGWKGVSISARCDALIGFDEIMNHPMSKSSFRVMAFSLNYEFMLNKNLIAGEAIGADTIKYEISDKGVDMIGRNEENKIVKEHYKINSISEDTLIYSKELKTSAPIFSGILKLLNAESDTNKRVIYTYVLYKIKEAKAPWTVVENDLPKNQESENLLVNNSAIFAILGGGFDNDSLFVSNDYGMHWRPSFKGLPELFGYMPSTSIAALDKKIFIGTPSGIFSSENSGQSWTKINNISPEHDSSPIISIVANNTNIFAFVDSVIYMSRDNEVNWRFKKMDVPRENLVDAHLSANGTQIILEGRALNEAFVLFSSDNGESWTDIRKNLDELDYPSILSSSFIAGTSIFMNTQYGMFTSKDKGATWNPGANGLPAHFRGNTIVENGNNIFFGSDQGVFLSVNNGENWVEVNNQEIRNGVNSLVIVDSNIFAITKRNKIYKASISELVNSIEKSKN